MQFLLKNIIHFYTGMRDQEVLKLRVGCVRVQEVVPAVVDESGILRDAPKTIDIISTTTKLTRAFQSESWIATEEVLKAVEVAEKICAGLSSLIDEPVVPNSTLIFLSPIVLRDKSKGPQSLPYFSKVSFPILATDDLRLTKDDVEELALSDPFRDFLAESKFAVGEFWSLTSHQYRRSLAYYASSSGFVSQPTLKKQFKHLCLLMTRYYSSNYENFTAFFGYFDKKRNERVVPGSHIAFEFQLGMSNQAAERIIAHLLDDEFRIAGGAATALKIQRNRYIGNEMSIKEVRSVTEKAVRNGEMAYRETLLGGCMKLGNCDRFMLGDVTSCLSCESAVIEPEKINGLTDLLEKEISAYSNDSGEYQICYQELEKLKRRADKFIKEVASHD